MRYLMIFGFLLFSLTVSAFEVFNSDFTTPNPTTVCSSSEAMFGGASVVYNDCGDDVDSIVATKIVSKRSFIELQQFIRDYKPDGSFTDYDTSDALYDGTVVAITPFDSRMTVASSGNVLRFCLSDRTVYLVKNDNDWSAVTVLPK